jgi:alkylation response protein AidB-like acyl-CoA dehydrogenase
MDLELSDEQTLLSESLTTLLDRNWPAPPEVATADGSTRRALWDSLVSFGALEVGGEDGLGAVELCLVARALGARLASAPFLGSVAVRYAGLRVDDAKTVSIALLEPGSGWDPATVRTTLDAGVLHGEKTAVEHIAEVDRLAVIASRAGATVLALIPCDARGVNTRLGDSLDGTVPLGSATLDGVEIPGDSLEDAASVDRVITAGALLAAAEATGAAGGILDEARGYAAERRQFGRTIGSFQALRHLLADMYVRHASAWSTVLYAAASLDDEAEDAAQTVSIAKAYVARSAREVAHGAMQVFGGIAFTEEHPAHRFLRRIVVREQLFGDAAHHERTLGRALASQAVRRHSLERSAS